MTGFLSLHDVRGVSVTSYQYKELHGDPAQGYTVMDLSVCMADGSNLTLTLFGDAKGIEFTAPGLEYRPCAECGNLMPRHYHPRVTVCSACETDGPPSEGPDVGQAPATGDLEEEVKSLGGF